MRVATQYALAPASLIVISCKYENGQRLQFTTVFAIIQTITTRKNKQCAISPSCANTVKAKQTTAEYGRRLCLLCPSNKLIFDLLTLKVVSESRVMCATSVPILVFLGLYVLDLGPIYATDRRQTSDVKQTDRR